MTSGARRRTRHSPLATRHSEWLELWTSAEPEAVDALAELFQHWGHGVAIEEPLAGSLDGDTVFIDPGRPVVVKTYLPVDERTSERRGHLETGVWHLGRLRHVERLQARLLAENDWANAWKRYFFVHRVGERVVIVPSWRRHRAQPDEVVIRLDPGMAFGTGLHPTTRMCVRALERWLRPGARVLDLGTGSGILAIAAAKLGAKSVYALDVDPVAVNVATDNVHRNRVARRVTVANGSLPLPVGAKRSVTEPLDLVLANIIKRVILELLDDIQAALAPRGMAILSGLLEEAQDEVRSALPPHGLLHLETIQEGDWITLITQRAG